MISTDGTLSIHRGPMRFAAPNGLRSLVEDLAAALPAGVAVRTDRNAAWLRRGAVRPWGLDAGPVTGGTSADPALPPSGWTSTSRRMWWRFASRHHRRPTCCESPNDPDLTGLADACARRRYEPLLALVAQWPQRSWEPFPGCFVNGDATIAFIADDGSRRGDGRRCSSPTARRSSPGATCANRMRPRNRWWPPCDGCWTSMSRSPSR